jgi:glutamine amidotransferase
LYFVHSFAAEPDDETVVAAWCDYGRRFAAAIEMGPVWATQFHPEKSGDVGMRMLRNFVEAVSSPVNA